MQILALDTTTETGSCALWRDGAVLEYRCPAGRPHSETLLPLVRQLLDEAGLRFAGLDAIAFGVGPGAFTGLRVACAVAQGLAVAADRRLVPVTSLAAMAAASGAERVLTLLDARMGEIYAAPYQRQSDGWQRMDDIRLCAPDDVAIPAQPAGWQAVGNALLAYPHLGERLAGAGLGLQPDILPLAGWVARLAAPLLAAGETIDASEAAPLYVRDKVAMTVAERLREGGKA